MVALNEKFSHSGLPASEGRVSPHEIDAFDFTKWSGEVWGGSVVNFGGAGFRGLSDASPLRRHSAAPVNRSDPESELHYVRNRTYSPALCTVLRRGLKSSGRPGRASKKIAVLQWIQRGPIGYSGGINLYEYVGGRAVVAVDPSGMDVTQQEVNIILSELKAELEKATAVGRGVHRIQEAIAALVALAGSQRAEKKVTEDLLDYLLDSAKDMVKGYGGAAAGAGFGVALEELKIALALAGVIYGPATRSRACNDCAFQAGLHGFHNGTEFPSGTTALAMAFAFGIPVYFVRYEIMCRLDCQGRTSVLIWVNQSKGYQWVPCGF